MRKFAEKNQIKVLAFPGTTGILFAMDLPKSKAKNFLGFSIEREYTYKGKTKKHYLKNLLDFPQNGKKVNDPVDSNKAPFQKFRWSDYAVYPKTKYTYTFRAHYVGNKILQGPTFTTSTLSISDGEHQIIFNRAAGVSQAFERKFPNIDISKYDPKSELDDDARKWLSRGLLEKMEDFVMKGLNKDHRVDICIYEFELDEIIDILKKARDKNVQMRLVYHAKPGDEQTTQNKRSATKLGLTTEFITPRKTNAINHHKFIVISKKKGEEYEPIRVLTGSTNFTSNGVYRQANVLHTIYNTGVALAYSQLFEHLFAQKKFDSKVTRKYNNTSTPIPQNKNPALYFSPRARLSETGEVVSLVKNAKQEYIFCTAFDLHDSLDKVLFKKQKGLVKYGLQNSKSKVKGMSKDANPFVTPAMIKKGVEKYLMESKHGQRGNLLIHLKCFVLDFLSKSPVVITGSNNFSLASSANNDENLLIIKGDIDVADIYINEMFRFYDHYRFRYTLKQSKKEKQLLALDPTDAWTEKYYDPESDYFTERVRFIKGWHPNK